MSQTSEGGFPLWRAYVLGFEARCGEGHLTAVGMALQYCPVDIPIRTRFVLLLAMLMAGGFLFFPPQKTSFPPDSFGSVATFPCTENAREVCPVPPALSAAEASFGEKTVWSLSGRSGAAYTPHERSTHGTSRLERGHAFSLFVALSGDCFCPGVLLRRGSISSAVPIVPRDSIYCRACPRSPPAVWASRHVIVPFIQS